MALSNTNQQLNEYLTVREAAEYLGVSPWTLRNWDKNGKLKPMRHPMNGYRIYRHDELAAILEASPSQHVCANDLAPAVDLIPAGQAEHIVQFYDQPETLIDSASAFILTGLEQGFAGIYIARKTFRDAIEKTLGERGIHVADVLAQGQLVRLDAEETLARFMVDGMPNRQRFQEALGGIIAPLVDRYGSLHAFGEMVALLWEQGNRQAAIRLEELWNELSQTHAFSLLCAYPLKGFTGAGEEEQLDHVCHSHSRVIPMERYAQLKSSEERLREVLRLQQKANSLEAEIEHRKEAEKSLMKREHELSDFFENAAEGIHKVGADGIILWANKAELDFLGYAPEDYIGHHIAEFHVDQDAIKDILQRLQNNETLNGYEARMRSKSGAIKYVMINSNGYEEDGKLVYTRCFTRDITEQKLNYEAQALLAAVVESSQDAILSITLDGTVLSWNSSAERLYGYTAEEMVGKSVMAIIPPDRLDEEYFILEKLRNGERIEHYESIRRAKNGQLIDVALTVSPVRDSQGNIIAASKVARDITEQKRIQRELREALERAKAASIAKSDFLANMSHELRTPLNAVIGLANLLQTPSIPWEKQREFTKTLQMSAQQLLDLINDLLDVSKLETEQMQLENIPFQVEEILAEIVSIHAVKAKEKGIELIMLPQAGIRAGVVGDPLRFRQILMNLVSNAIKFTEQGSVVVKTACEEQADGKMLIRIEVQDTGIGIGSDKLDSIFNKFTQGDTSITRKFGGSGLGLTITKTLTEMMGGTIQVQSSLGEGSCFTIAIPFAKRDDVIAKGPSATPAPAAHPHLHCHVLLVEDYPANILVATTVLQQLGCTYDIAKTGKEALALIQEKSFDVVLMDVQMPEMDGFQATRLLRQWEKEKGKRRTPVIGMTAHALRGDKERCLEIGMDDYISKPFQPEDLEQKLATITACFSAAI